jgi:hypothetical protein
MKHLFSGIHLLGAIALLALASGCANTQHTENLLSAAGFRTIVADTPQRQQRLADLPPNKVTWRNGMEKVITFTQTRLTTGSLLAIHLSIKNISSSAWPTIWPRMSFKRPD